MREFFARCNGDGRGYYADLLFVGAGATNGETKLLSLSISEGAALQKGFIAGCIQLEVPPVMPLIPRGIGGRTGVDRSRTYSRQVVKCREYLSYSFVFTSPQYMRCRFEQGGTISINKTDTNKCFVEITHMAFSIP